MRIGDKVIYLKLNGAFEFGSEHIVQETCIVLDSMTVIGSDRICKMSEFTLPVAPAAGQWWITRGRVVVLIASVEGDRMLVVVPEGASCRLEMYYATGRYSQSQMTGLDLICQASGSVHSVGDYVGAFGREELLCSC
jgi:hypothetical protein